jgi:penicillin amidase
MRKISSYAVLSITLLVTLLLNTSIGSYPPIARFLDPFQGFWQNAEVHPLELPTYLSLKGLKDTVHVYFDEHLIPHIKAKNDYDLYFAQGYITAFHRLWQMEFQTHAAAGRLAEVVGSIAVEHDRLQRRKGMVYAAKNALEKINQDPVSRETVHAYTAGINAYINSLTYKTLPIEYKLLAYKPEAWTPFKVALMSVQMADNLGGYERSLQNVYAFHLLGETKFSLLFPEYDVYQEPIVPKGTPWSFKPLDLKPYPIHPHTIQHDLLPPLLRTEGHQAKQSSVDGSNNWAVAGKKTVHGYPYLANDPHLNMRLPAIWYGIHLESPTVNVAGSSLPGAPGVLIGFNESIAWGLTNAAWTVRDLYAISFKDATRAEYYYDNLLLKSQFVVEQIKIKNSQPLYDTVVYTHLGPIVYDDRFEGPGHYKNVAMKWVGHHPGNEILTFYLINRGKNLQEFESALQHYHVPAQNFAFASVYNEIALEIAGKLPARLKNQGKFIMPGNSNVYELQAYIPQAHCPKVVNPAVGYVSSANERATDKNYPYHYYQFSEENYRNRRLNQALSQATKIDLKSMMQLQNDNYNLAAQENLPFLMGYIDKEQLSDQEQQAYQTLLDWNLQNDVGQVAPSIFRAWQDQLIDKLWGYLHDFQLEIRKPSFYQTMSILKNRSIHPHLELPAQDGLRDLIVDSFKSAIQHLQAWQANHRKLYKWGDYHAINIPHLAFIKPFGIDHVQIGGGEGIVNANEGSHGVSMRLIVSLDKTPKAWFIYPGGQTGNPGNPYYTKFVVPWSQGKYIPLTLTIPKDDKRPFNMVTLVPA